MKLREGPSFGSRESGVVNLAGCSLASSSFGLFTGDSDDDAPIWRGRHEHFRAWGRWEEDVRDPLL